MGLLELLSSCSALGLSCTYGGFVELWDPGLLKELE